jgi:NADPH2:quinone reductase
MVDAAHPSRAVRFHRTGGPEVLVLEDITVADPVGAEVLIRVAAAGVNFMDLYHRLGDYPATLPSIPGIEGAGQVVAVGPDVTDLTPGTMVAFTRPIVSPGAYADLTVVDRATVAVIPPGVSTEVAAAVLIQGLSAHYLCNDAHQVKPGETVLVHAAAGGLGLLLTQMATAKGARVIGTASSEAKEAAAREAGAWATINYSHEDLVERTNAITEGEGVHAVFDGVGAATFDGSLQVLRPRGSMVVFGTPSGDLPLLDTWRIWEKSLKFTRTQIKHHTTEPEFRSRSEEVFASLAAGALDVRIDSRHPLEEAGAAQSRLESRKNIGKVLVVL